jgi:hypothetical protein
MTRVPAISLGLAVMLATSAAAHEMRPGYLEIRQSSPDTYSVLWKVPARGENERLSLHLRFDEDVEILGEPVSGFRSGAHVQRMRIRRDGGLDGSRVTIDGLSRTFTDVLLRIERADGTRIAHRLTPQAPGYLIEPNPGWGRVAWTYTLLGIEHILLGIDHLLFVLGLLLLVDRRMMLIKTVTSFTIAHSITLALSVFSIIAVPAEALNAAIALSILFLGPEIVRKWRGGDSLTIRHPWVVAFLFGLLHGIGFASGLSMTGLPKPDIPLALLFFNVGVELGQLAFVVLALLVAHAARSLALDRPAWVPRVPGYAVGILGAFWTIQRVSMILTTS